jgi:hypothetical protein
MPTADDFGAAGDYTRVRGTNNFNPVITTAVDGTGAIDNGYSFTDPKAGSTVFFPASGTRSDATGAVSFVGVFGYAWSSSPSGTNGYSLIFYGTGVLPASSSYPRALGYPVRCVRKK